MSDLDIVAKAVERVTKRDVNARVRFSPSCPVCYGTGDTDHGRLTNKPDGGCATCHGTGRINDLDGYAALRRLMAGN